jgi:acyl dehydratase
MMQTETEIRYHYEDLQPGREFPYAPRAVTPEEIIAFAREFDPQEMHLSEEGGRASILGGLAASGWHSCAMMMRMFFDALLEKTASEGAPGVDFVEWRKPVLSGDTLSGRSIILDRRELKSRPGIGLVHMRHEVTNQRGELVLVMENPGMVRLRARKEAAA